MRPPLDPEIARLTEEADRLWQGGQSAAAFPFAVSAHSRARRLHRTSDHPDLSQTTYYIGNISWSLGRVIRAFKYLEESIAIDRRMGSDGDLHGTAQSLNSLGTCKNTWGDFRGAMEAFKEADKITADLRANEGDSPDLQRTYSATLRGMGEVCRSQGNLLGALGYHKRSLDIEQDIYIDPKLKPVRKSGMHATLDKLATIHHLLGNPSEGLRIYGEALKNAYRQSSDPESSLDVANLYHNRANILLKIGNHDPALQDYEHALRIKLASVSVTGVDTLSIAATHHGLSQALMRLGQLDAALENSLKSLHMRHRIQGETAVHPDIATNLNGLANIYVYRGDDDMALRRYEEALAIRNQVYRDEDRVYDHTYTAETLYSLSLLHTRQGRYEQAWNYGKKSVDMTTRLFRGYYTFLTPEVLKSTERLSHLMMLTLRYFPNDKDKAKGMFESVSQHKAMETQLRLDMGTVVLEGRYPEHEHMITAWREVNQTIALLSWEDARRHEILLQQLKLRRQVLEQSIFQSVPELRNKLTLDGVTASRIAEHLPSETLLVEYIRFDPLDSTDPEWSVPHYAAFVLAKTQSLPTENIVTLVDLGPNAVSIDEHIKQFRQSQSDSETSREGDITARLLASVDAVNDLTANEQLQRLFIETWKPIQSAIAEGKRILVAPHHELNYLPFEILIPYPNANYLVDAGYRLAYLSSGCDLLRYEASTSDGIQPPQQRGGMSLVIGDPDFSIQISGADQPLEPADEAARDAFYRYAVRGQRGFLGRLPFSGLEAQRVAKRLNVLPFLGADAIVSLVQNVRSPRILHLATHAFYLNELDLVVLREYGISNATDERLSAIGMQSDAFLKGVVCFAGAKTFIDGGALPRDVAPGVLVGTGIITLRLSDTEIVNLSVCDSGFGLASTGRGVMGLRAAFQEAGCRRLVVALWSVDDMATAILMDRFYSLLEKNEIGQDSSSVSPVLVDDCLRQAQKYLRSVTARELAQEWFNEDTLSFLRSMHEAAHNDDKAQALFQGYIDEVEGMRNPKCTDPDSCPYAPVCYWAGFVCQGDPFPYGRA